MVGTIVWCQSVYQSKSREFAKCICIVLFVNWSGFLALLCCISATTLLTHMDIESLTWLPDLLKNPPDSASDEESEEPPPEIAERVRSFMVKAIPPPGKSSGKDTESPPSPADH